jgi:hypothetical protein
VIDYDLYPSDYSNAVIRRIAAAALSVDFRGDYPLITQADLARYRMIVLESSAGTIGSGLVPARNESTALVRWVQRGGLLVLAVPQDPEAFDKLPEWNAILEALHAGITVKPAVADDDAGRYPSAMFPQCTFRPTDTFAAKGVNQALVLDRATILETKAPALSLATTSPTAFARVGLGRAILPEMRPTASGFSLIAMARCGQGFVLVIPRFSLNIGGFTGRVGVGPTLNLDWVASSERFVQNIIDELVALGNGTHAWPGQTADIRDVPKNAANTDLPAAPPVTLKLQTFPPRKANRLSAHEQDDFQQAYRATIRRDLYGEYLDHGLRAGWGNVERDDGWIKSMCQGFKQSGFNYLWGVGWPERFVSPRYKEPARANLKRAWETMARELDGSRVGWSIGVDFPGVGFDRSRYEQCRGVDGQTLKMMSPLDLRYWYEFMIPALEEVARFGLDHPSVKGATIDFEMYGSDPFIIYPESVGFEDVAYHAFLRASAGHLDARLLAEAATLIPAQRYAWLRDHALLSFFFLQLENESERLGRLIRQRIHAIHPRFIFGAYQAALPYQWFYRGLMRGLSTPEMPMIWMSFQVLSADDVDRFWRNGCHILNASAIMLGTIPIADYPAAMKAGRSFHDGYWINRYDWLIDDAKGRKTIEIPNGTRDAAWQSLKAGNDALDRLEKTRKNTFSGSRP